MDIKNAKAIHDKELIYELIEEGEHVQQDFKFAITDSRKIARSISAFANNCGGRLLIGVKDNGNIAGIKSEEEYYMIEQAAEMYCKPAIKVKQIPYNIEGRLVLLVMIPKSDYLVKAPDENRKWKYYYRVEDENIQMSSLMVKAFIARMSKNKPAHITEIESNILRLVSEKENINLRAIARCLHLSVVTVEDAMVRLFSIGLVEFVHCNDSWKIIVSR